MLVRADISPLLFDCLIYEHIPLHIHYTHWTDRVLYRTYVVRLGRCVTLSLCLYLSRSALSYTERSVCFLRAACQYSIWQMLKLYLVLSRRMFGIVVHCCWCIFSLSFWWFTLFIIYIFFLLLLPVLFLVLLLSLLSSIYSYFLCHSSVHLYEWSSKNSCLCKRDFRVLTKVCGFYSICLSSNHCIDHLMVRIFM